MLFYCPVCRQTVEINPETTLTTKLNQQAYKAHCPTCQQDLACYGTTAEPDAQTAIAPAATELGSVV